MGEPQLGLTQLLQRWHGGDRAVEAELIAAVYPALKRLAASQVRRHGGVLTLGPTELLHEAYERLAQQRRVDWNSRRHFYAIAATVLRRVVVDYVRLRSAKKRGGSEDVMLPMEEGMAPAGMIDGQQAPLDWLDLDRAMQALHEADELAVQVVEMKVFAGLTLEEVADALAISVASVGRKWRFARAFLSERMAAQ